MPAKPKGKTVSRKPDPNTKPRDAQSAAVELARILSEQSAMAAAIKAAFHYTLLWRYKTGARRPDYPRAVKLRKLTRGRIPEKSWYETAAG